MNSNDNTTVTPFDFVGQRVRTIMRKGCPGFVLADVCRVLEIGNPRQAATRLDEDEKNTVTTNDGTPGNPNTTIVNESGLYSLILTSRKPEAKAFKKWITSVVLPAIRKGGGYMVARPEEAVEELSVRLMGILNATIERQKAELEVAAPKVALVDATFAQGGDIG